MESALDTLLTKALTPSVPTSRVDAECESDGDDELEMRSHEGVVFLDILASGVQELVHTSTHERHTLPTSCRWSLKLGEDGFGVVEPCGAHTDEEPLLVEDLFRFQLYNNSKGDEAIVSIRGGMPDIVLLTEFSNRYLEMQVTLLGVPRSADKELVFSIRKYTWARHGACVFFPCRSLYDCLDFTMFPDQPWRWSWKSAPSWDKRLIALGLRAHCICTRKVVP